MAVPTTTAFNPAAVEIYTDMYRTIGVIAEDEPPTAAQFNIANFKMNSLVKGLAATGIHVWTEQEGIVFLNPGQARYTLGSAGANANTSTDGSWTQGALNVSAPTGSASVTLISASGVSDGDTFGVVLDSGDTFWTTVAGAPAGNIVALAAALTGNASANAVTMAYAASTQMGRPLKVPRARTYYFQGGQETSMTVMSRQEYEDLPIKLNTGVPTQFFYTPQLGLGWLYVWPVPVTTNWAIRCTWYRDLADLLTVTDNIDFPQEWIAPLTWFLADEMKVGYSIPEARAAMIEKRAAAWLETVTDWDRESEPVQFGMDWQLR